MNREWSEGKKERGPVVLGLFACTGGVEYGVSRKQRVDAGERSRTAPPTRPNGALRIDGGGDGAGAQPERMKRERGGEQQQQSRREVGEVGLCSRWFGRWII